MTSSQSKLSATQLQALQHYAGLNNKGPRSAATAVALMNRGLLRNPGLGKPYELTDAGRAALEAQS